MLAKGKKTKFKVLFVRSIAKIIQVHQTEPTYLNYTLTLLSGYCDFAQGEKIFSENVIMFVIGYCKREIVYS